MFVACEDRLMSARHCVPLTLAQLRKAKSVKYIRVWIDALIRLNGARRHGDKCACGNRHTIGKCERVQREAAHGHWGKAENELAYRTWDARKKMSRTGGNTAQPLGLPEKTIYLVHLVYPSFRPAFIFDYSVHLLAEGFKIFWIGKKTVQRLRDRLLICND